VARFASTSKKAEHSFGVVLHTRLGDTVNL
jgi:hypothetical protein